MFHRPTHRAWCLASVFVCCALVVITVPPTRADTSAATQSATDTDAQYTAVITERSQKIVDTLGLRDVDAQSRVRNILVSFYRQVNDWHDANGATRTQLSKANTEESRIELRMLEAQLAELRNALVTSLSTDLSAEQVELVKDGLTFRVLHVTRDAYLDMLPQLSSDEKAQILAWLTEARDLAMCEGSSSAKHAVFGKYKGRINNYLSKRGYDLKQATKDWQQRLKERAATRPGK